MKNIGVYIHIPFCERKCPYCDFYSVKSGRTNIDRYTSAITGKIYKWGKTLERKADTLYFGGGTPSYIGADRLALIADSVRLSFGFENAEITAEINPTKEDFDFEKLLKSGFNRVSIGVQSANDEELQVLGRLHTVRHSDFIIKKAQSAGFENISLDLMIATPLQTKDSLERSIEFCAEHNVQHISSYILKVEEGTPYCKIKDLLNLPDDDGQAEMYLFACEKLKEYGYHQYEISNFAKDGFECRHNLKYWNDEDYLGIGPSAHSFIDGKRFYYPPSIDTFMNETYVKDGEGGSEEEYIMLRLRLAKGINNDEYKKRFGHKIPEKYFRNARKFIDTDYVVIDDNSIRFTTKGFIVSNALITEILA